jgi:hypothetical protein
MASRALGATGRLSTVHTHPKRWFARASRGLAVATADTLDAVAASRIADWGFAPITLGGFGTELRAAVRRHVASLARAIGVTDTRHTRASDAERLAHLAVGIGDAFDAFTRHANRGMGRTGRSRSARRFGRRGRTRKELELPALAAAHHEPPKRDPRAPAPNLHRLSFAWGSLADQRLSQREMREASSRAKPFG